MPARTSLTLADLLTGLLAALAQRRVIGLPLRHFDQVVADLTSDVEREVSDKNLKVCFRVIPHPIHGDSEAVHEALYTAAQSRLIRLSGTEITIQIAPDEALAYLTHLPGTPEMYDRLAAKLLDLLGY